jgi:transcriptional regulator with XRE-family HTH domain
MMERNSKLEAARRLRGWSLEVASQKIGVHPRTLRRWETGKSRPHGFRVYKISEVYESTPTALGIGSDYHMLSSTEETRAPEQDLLLSHFAEPVITIEDLDLHLMGLILQRKLDRQNLDYQAFQLQIHQRIREYDDYMKEQKAYSPSNPARLQALRVVASIPIAAYLENISQDTLPAPAEDILTHCASAITACWHMSQGEDLVLARSLVSGYLVLLSEIFTHAAHCRQATAELIAQACLLRTMLALQLESQQASVSYYTQALEFSRIAENTETSIASPVHAHTLPGYGKQPEQALRKIAESIWLLKPAPPLPDFPLVRDYLQKISTLYQVPLGGEHGELDQSSELHHFPPSIDYAEAALNLWDGITYHELTEYAQALDASQPNSQEKPVCDAPEPVRLEFLPNRALASLRLHDMDQEITTLRASLPQALSLGNEQELLEARKAYHLVQFLQPGEVPAPVAELKDLLKKHD